MKFAIAKLKFIYIEFNFRCSKYSKMVLFVLNAKLSVNRNLLFVIYKVIITILEGRYYIIFYSRDVYVKGIWF